MKKILKTKKGFTLIELLVVIGIIGILSTIGAVSFGGARAKARDAKRQGDLRALQSALEIDAANDSLGLYEASAASWVTWLTNMGQSGTIMPPGNTSATDTYCYYTDTARTKYVLVAEGHENVVTAGSYNLAISAALGAGGVAAVSTSGATADCPAVATVCAPATAPFIYCLRGGT